MEFLTALWLPIVVSAVFVWIMSFFTHMVFPHHRKDWSPLPDEEKIMSAVTGLPPGNYMFPFCDHSNMNSPEMVEKRKKGPIGILTVYDGEINMGKNLILTLLSYVLAGIFVAYVGWHSLATTDPYLTKFRICGAVALASYALGWIGFVIWYKNIKFWSNLFDAILYALITAGVFGWLWPK